MRAVLALSISLAAAPLAAAAFETITDRDTFLAAVEGRALRIGLLGISLTVTGEGAISGQAQGSPVTGAWTWEGGLFCRHMTWGDRPIGHNCQKVEIDGARIRFTVDAGAGQSAVFTID